MGFCPRISCRILKEKANLKNRFSADCQINCPGKEMGEICRHQNVQSQNAIMPGVQGQDIIDQQDSGCPDSDKCNHSP